MTPQSKLDLALKETLVNAEEFKRLDDARQLQHCCGRTVEECGKDPGPVCAGTVFKRASDAITAEAKRITPEDTAAFFKKIDDAMGVPSAVDHPHYYNQGKVECIDAIAAATTGLTGIEAWDTGTVLKYMWRWKHKANPIEDLEKAKWYLNHLIEHLKKEST